MLDKVIKTTFEELQAMNYASVTDYCRVLVAKGTPEGSIHVYRGEMLCLTVTDIPKAAKLMPTSEGWAKYKPFPKNKPKLAGGLAQDAFK